MKLVSVKVMNREQIDKLAAYGPDVYHSISESKTRRVVLCYLKKAGASTPYRISREAKLDYGNISGAIFGNGRRFSFELSLVFLGLIRVDTYAVNKKTISLTPAGLEIAGLIEQVLEWSEPYEVP